MASSSGPGDKPAANKSLGKRIGDALRSKGRAIGDALRRRGKPLGDAARKVGKDVAGDIKIGSARKPATSSTAGVPSVPKVLTEPTNAPAPSVTGRKPSPPVKKSAADAPKPASATAKPSGRPTERKVARGGTVATPKAKPSVTRPQAAPAASTNAKPAKAAANDPARTAQINADLRKKHGRKTTAEMREAAKARRAKRD